MTHAQAGNAIVDGQVSVAGWRSAHPSLPATPWSQQTVTGSGSALGQSANASFAGIPGLPEHVQLTGNGQLNVQGLDWLGARLYDPSTRGFLNTDPLEPATGAGWAANPYSYAGNDPVHQIDPLGLSPVSAEELAAYSDAHQGWANKAWNWTLDNHEVILGVGSIVAGVALTATGVGGPAGIAMVAAGVGVLSVGMSAAEQHRDTGTIDWWQAASEGAINASNVLFGGQMGTFARVVGMKGIGQSIARVGGGAKNLLAKIPGAVQKAKGAAISTTRSLNAQAQSLKSRAGVMYQGVASNVRAGAQSARSGATLVKNRTATVYRGVSSKVRTGAQSAISRTKTGTSNFFKENWTDMWKTSVANAPIEASGNLGWSYIAHKAESDDPYTFREGFAAATAGVVSGGLGGVGPLSKVIPNEGLSNSLSIGLGAGASEAALYTESGIKGEDVTLFEQLWGAGTGGLMSKFPGAKYNDDANPSFGEYLGSGGGGLMAGTSLEALKLAGVQGYETWKEEHSQK